MEGLTRIGGGGGGGGGGLGKFLMPRKPLSIGLPNGRPFLESERMAGICRWIWRQSGSTQLFSQLDVEFIWCWKVVTCQA